MTALSVTNPQSRFTDAMGLPLSAGKLYVGRPEASAKTSQVTLYKNTALTQTVGQPVSIENGYLVDGGEIINVYIDGPSYSITVEDVNDEAIFASPLNWKRDNIQIGSKIESIANPSKRVQLKDLGKLFRCSRNVTIESESAQALGNGFIFGVKNAGSSSIVTLSLPGGIDGVTTHTLSAMESALIGCNGSSFNFYARSSGTALSTSEYDFVDHKDKFIATGGSAVTAAVGRYTLKIPPTRASIGGRIIQSSEPIYLSLGESANWLPGEEVGVFHTADNRKGKDIYVYMSDGSSSNRFRFSTRKGETVLSTDNSVKLRLIAQFHCLCADVGSISDNDLSGYVKGDILPKSIQWKYNHPKTDEPDGFCRFSYSDWASIYMLSYKSSDVRVAFNQPPLLSGPSDIGRTTKQVCEIITALIGKGWRLPDRNEFLKIYEGTDANPGRLKVVDKAAAIAVCSGGNKTGSDSDSGRKRIISSHGHEDMSGVWTQISRDEMHVSDTDVNYTTQSGAILKGKAYDMLRYISYGSAMTIGSDYYNDTAEKYGPNTSYSFYLQGKGDSGRTTKGFLDPDWDDPTRNYTKTRPYAYRAVCYGVRE